MHTLIITLLLLALCCMAWQDFADRAIDWYFFPLVLVLLIGNSVLAKGFSWTSVGLNMGLVLVQLFFVHLYLRWTRGHSLMHGERMLGWGDVLFFLLLTLAFSPLNFIVFYIASLGCTLLLTLMIRWAGRPMPTIPLAGCQALLLAVVLLMDTKQQSASLYNDLPLLNLFDYAAFSG